MPDSVERTIIHLPTISIYPKFHSALTAKIFLFLSKLCPNPQLFSDFL